MPTRLEVPPAWRFNWAAARPPLFITQISVAVTARDSVVTAVTVTYPATVVVPIITTRPCLQLRTEHRAGRRTDNAARHGAASLAGSSTADDRASRTADERTTERIILRHHRLQRDERNHRGRSRSRNRSSHGNFLLCAAVLGELTILLNRPTGVDHSDDSAPQPLTGGRIECSRLQRVNCFDELKERGYRKRRGEYVALRGAHAKRPQVHHLFEILDAFGDHIHAHVARKVDERFDDGGGIAIGADSIHEDLVDLDDVDPELEHVGQPAVAGADVIDRDTHTKALQGGNDLPRFGKVLDRVAFGYFQHHLWKLDRRARKDVADVLHDRRLAEQLAGKIERDFQVRTSAD